VPSESALLRSSRQNIGDGRVVSIDVVRGDLPKHVGATLHK
jgi:hypothetical protein